MGGAEGEALYPDESRQEWPRWLVARGRDAIVLTMASWRLWTAGYRTLVVVQTVGWAAASLANVIARRPRPAVSTDRVGLAFTVASVFGLVGGLLAYYRRGARPTPLEARTLIVTWACVQAAGLSALAGYAITGEVVCFGAGIVTLMVMHAFSPNRFPNVQKPEA